jgi:hypothetical protein
MAAHGQSCVFVAICYCYNTNVWTKSEAACGLGVPFCARYFLIMERQPKHTSGCDIFTLNLFYVRA